jgi:hypothetical protein
LLAVYLASLAPGLTWANSGADGGDLISAAATNGVAHPTGYPTYLLVARLFQFLPFGSLAFRTNLLSAAAAAVAAVLVYSLTIRHLSPDKPHRYWLAGLAGGLGFGLAPLAWSQAVITEVYSLQALFVVLLLVLSEHQISPRFSEKWKDILLGLVFGLSLGNHITMVFLLPVVFSSLINWRSENTSATTKARHFVIDWRSFSTRLLWMGIGLLVYTSLPLKALSHPPVNWGDPATPAGFGWLISGKLYQGQYLAISFPSLLDRIGTTAALYLDQFGLIGLTLAFIGLIIYFKPVRLYFSLPWIFLAFTIFSIIYATNDSYVYLIPAVLSMSAWLGIAVGRLMDAAAQKWKPLPGILVIAVLLAFSIQAGLHWNKVDASSDDRAESFARDVLSLAPRDAIIFAQGDRAIFSLWYFHYALHDRPDMAVIASDLLQFDWYLQTLRITYPDLNLSEPYPFPETVIALNPTRSYCYVSYVQLPEITCLPPGGFARH